MPLTIPTTIAIENQEEVITVLKEYAHLLFDYNSMVNLISRKSTLDDVYRHIEHSLWLATRRFPQGAVVVDWGSGGGLPAIPIAIVFPEVSVIAVDTIGKKVAAIDHFISELGLENIAAWNGRAEDFDESYHYSVSRATARLQKLWSWHKRNHVRLPDVPGNECWPPGLLALKGGDLSDEIRSAKKMFGKLIVDQYPIDQLGGLPAEEKYIVSVR